MRWLRLDIPCPPELTEVAAALVLAETGRGAAVVPGQGHETVQAFVPEAEGAVARERLTARLAAAGPPLSGLVGQMTTAPLPDLDWSLAWRAHFRAFRVSDRLVVKPPWEAWPPAEDPSSARETDIILEIDPGHAFGTGTHATTQLALRALDGLVLPGMVVVDVGCGSGILSLAAVELGARLVIAVDVDYAAVESTAEALEAHVRRRAAFVVQAGGLAALSVRADLVVANITAEPVARVGEEAGDRLRPGGLYIATGLLQEQEEAVAQRLAGAGLRLRERDEQEGWACLTFSREGEGEP